MSLIRPDLKFYKTQSGYKVEFPSKGICTNVVAISLAVDYLLTYEGGPTWKPEPKIARVLNTVTAQTCDPDIKDYARSLRHRLSDPTLKPRRFNAWGHADYENREYDGPLPEVEDYLPAQVAKAITLEFGLKRYKGKKVEYVDRIICALSKAGKL